MPPRAHRRCRRARPGRAPHPTPCGHDDRDHGPRLSRPGHLVCGDLRRPLPLSGPPRLGPLRPFARALRGRSRRGTPRRVGTRHLRPGWELAREHLDGTDAAPLGDLRRARSRALGRCRPRSRGLEARRRPQDVRVLQRRRDGRRPGVGGRDVRGSPPPRRSHGRLRLQRLAGRRPGDERDDDRARPRQVAGFRMARGGRRRPRRRRARECLLRRARRPTAVGGPRPDVHAPRPAFSRNERRCALRRPRRRRAPPRARRHGGASPRWERRPVNLLPPPWARVLKPYGTALLEVARSRPDVVAVGADLTKQTETDFVRDQLPDQFVNVGMAEQNMIGVAAGMARAGSCVFVHTFGVFATRRPYEQIAMQIAYPELDVKIVGFMPGLSSPGGPSHQAIDDVALMRALPNMSVLEAADATEVGQAVRWLAERRGPCYLRVKRGEVPVLFGPAHRLDPPNAQWLRRGAEVAILASGMLVGIALEASVVLESAGLSVSVLNVASIKPIDRAAVLEAASSAQTVISAENHSVVGGLGSAVAEVLAEAGSATPLRRVGVQDVFAQASSAAWLFRRHGLDVDAMIAAAWEAAGRTGSAPSAPEGAEMAAPPATV